MNQRRSWARESGALFGMRDFFLSSRASSARFSSAGYLLIVFIWTSITSPSPRQIAFQADSQLPFQVDDRRWKGAGRRSFAARRQLPAGQLLALPGEQQSMWTVGQW